MASIARGLLMSLALGLLAACGGGGAGGAGGGGGGGGGDGGVPPDDGVFSITPASAYVAPGGTLQLTASKPATFELDPQSPGQLSATGLYTAPPSGTGAVHVFATSIADPAVRAMSDIYVRTGGAIDPFFAPAVTAGTLKVRLYPTEGVATGSPVLVTFGVPFPRGSITAANLTSVRVLDASGAEVSAYVAQQTPWRNYASATLDGAWVRVARIQIHHTFAVTYPQYEEVSVTWGGAARTLNVASLTDPRSAWHVCTSGTFVAGDGVKEPDVFAVLPAEWLAAGVLPGRRTVPLDPSVSVARDDPAVTDLTEHWSGFKELDQAAKDFFYTSINEDDPLVTAANQCHYKTDFEPWLYDRSATFYQLYFRSGFFKVLREAVRAADFYKNHLYPAGTTPEGAVGVFNLKIPDPSGYIGANGAMYSYNECLAYTYWLTGDDTMLDGARWVMSALANNVDGELTRWSPTLPAWTERHTGFRLLGTVIGYELFGDAAYADAVKSQVEDFRYNQDGAGGNVPTPHVDGGMWHLMSQHEGSDDPKLIASVWMTALVVDAIVRAYGSSEDAGIADFVRRTGNFAYAGTKVVPPSEYEYGENLREVDYITYLDGTTYAADGTTGEHALEVAGVAAWASYFADLLDKPDARLRVMADELYLTYDVSVNYWTRPTAPTVAGLPAYRLQNGVYRKYGWMYRPSSSLPWLLR